MRQLCSALVVLVIGVSVVQAATSPVLFNITMPKDAVADEEDAYVCTTLQLPSQPMKLVGIEPLAKQEVVHHILLFGCSVPNVAPTEDNPQPVWDCKRAPTCGSFEETVMYGWGRNAPKLMLPEGVGFSVGGSSSIRYIVAQVHYLKPKPRGDMSGVSLTLQADPVPYSAGMYSFATWFDIPPRKKEHRVQNDCCYRGFQPLRTFAMRVHTHGLGRSVFMERPRKNGTGVDVLARGDPLKPQGFNPVTPTTLFPGDRLSVSCIFDSSGVDHVVSAGPTHDHEMCNMYMMLYSPIPHIEMCNDGEGLIADSQPGNLPVGAKVLRDPYPKWKPPKAADPAPGGKGDLGDATSVAFGPDGKLWALHRGGAEWDVTTFDEKERLVDPRPVKGDVVVQMDPDTGAILRSWGAGVFYLPHMISVDSNGDVWVTDVGRHQVLKFSQEGKLLMEVGEKLVPGSDNAHFCKPTQVAFLRDGSFVVSDGYCNSRAVKFGPGGKFAGKYEVGAPASPQPSVVHSVAIDECGNRLYLADREGKRVLVFDLDTRKATLIHDLSRYGRVWALRPGPYGRVLAVAWELGSGATLVEVSQYDPAMPVTWRLPDSDDLWPHDLALGAAPLALSGTGDRLIAVFVAPLCAVGCDGSADRVKKFVMFPPSYSSPAEAAAAAAAAAAKAPKSSKPVLAHFGGHGREAATAAATGAAAGAAAPAGRQGEQEQGRAPAGAEGQAQAQAGSDGGEQAALAKESAEVKQGAAAGKGDEDEQLGTGSGEGGKEERSEEAQEDKKEEEEEGESKGKGGEEADKGKGKDDEDEQLEEGKPGAGRKGGDEEEEGSADGKGKKEEEEEKAGKEDKEEEEKESKEEEEEEEKKGKEEEDDKKGKEEEEKKKSRAAEYDEEDEEDEELLIEEELQRAEELRANATRAAAAAAASDPKRLAAAAAGVLVGGESGGEDGVGEEEVHEAVHSGPAATRRQGALSTAAQVVLPGAVLAVLVAALAVNFLQSRAEAAARRRRGGGGGGAGPERELAKLTNGRRGGCGGLLDGDGGGGGGGVYLNGSGGAANGINGRHGKGAAADDGWDIGEFELDDLDKALPGADDDLERMEREVLLRGQPRGGPGRS